jgi:transposase
MLAFEDEAGFGRILDVASCWAPPKQRPCVPNERHREFRTVYGIVIPQTGERFFEVYDKNNNEIYADFLKKVAEKFPNHYIVICCDRAGWHTTKKLKVPKNICLFFIPPHTPEMNPIEDEKTADIRIAQYESGTRTPKEKLTSSIANALKVSPRTLDVPDIDSYVGLAHTLFALEDLYGIRIGEIDGELCLRLDKEKGMTYLSMLDILSAWHREAAKLRDGEITVVEYDAWRYNYPKANEETGVEC